MLAIAAFEGLDREPPKLGLTVSRKVGSAVVRNRVKRLLREWFRAARSSLPRGAELVVIARPQARELDLAGVRAELSPLLEQAFGAEAT